MITICIPVFNMQEFICDAIDSALAQTQPCNIIVVDDGSTDHSLDIAKRYEEENANLKVVSQVNKGLASARNTGIMNSDDEYILFLDADDILAENCLYQIQQTIDKTDADIIAPSFKEFGLGNALVILKENPTIEDFKIANYAGYCQAIRRKTLLEVGGYNPKMVWGAEDLDLTIDLLKRGKKLVTIPEVLWLYRIRENSMWRETAKHKEEFMNQIHINHPEVFANEKRHDII